MACWRTKNRAYPVVYAWTQIPSALSNKPAQNGPLIYLSVEGRLDDAAKAVRANGGKILQEKHAFGPRGFRVVTVDSEGNRIALHSSIAGRGWRKKAPTMACISLGH